MIVRAPVDSLTGLEAASFGLYVHFPYCLSKCPYCDFASTAAREVPDGRYTDVIVRELNARLDAAHLQGRTLESIFFGGGTPSLWAPASVQRVLDAVSARLRLADGCEITLEANPGASDMERFAAYRAAGINRLSMGVQSFDLPTLQRLGRGHDGPTAVKAYERARAAGFENVSMDFIYGVHGQTVAEVEVDARQAVTLGADHLSAYALTLDRPSLAEDVPLAKQLARGEVHLPPEDTVVAMQRTVRDVFRASGLERYEISNYARPGRHSRHNSLYWTGGEYLAVGTGATGFLRDSATTGVRYSNQRSADRYLTDVEQGRLPEQSREPLGVDELFEERVAMGLRLASGLALEETCRRFGQSFAERELTVRHLVSGGLAEWHEGRLRLTDAGFDVHSAIAARLM